MVQTRFRRLARTALGASPLLLLTALAACHPEPVAYSPQPVASLEEVSIGYGTQTRRDMTGAISSANDLQMSAQTHSRVEEMMVGRFAGVDVTNVGGNYQIRIRGNRSIMGNNDPLVVVDGVVLTEGVSALSMISPSDVARIDVLKDAASTAMYGSRGANGVILIKLRRE